MKISEWKKATKQTNQQIAERLTQVIGKLVSHETVRLHVIGARLPTQEIARAYWTISDGAIDGNDLYNLPPTEPGQQPAQGGVPG